METELAIKETYVNGLREYEIDAEASGVFIIDYYGTYDGLVVVNIHDNFSGFFPVVVEKSIGGAKFKYNNSNDEIII